LCRFLGRLHHETIHAPTTGVREGPSNEIAGRKGLGFTDANYGDLRSVSVSFQEFGKRAETARRVLLQTGRGVHFLSQCAPASNASIGYCSHLGHMNGISQI
jgi:hypothetical protein